MVINVSKYDEHSMLKKYITATVIIKNELSSQIDILGRYTYEILCSRIRTYGYIIY